MQISPFYNTNVYPFKNVYIPYYTQKKNPQYFSEQGDDLMQRKSYDYAISSYQKSLILSPNNKALILKLARAYKGKKDYETSIKSINSYIAAAPQDSEAKILLGETYLERGDYKEALECFKNAMEADPNDDNAKRNFLDTQNKILEQTNPKLAKQQRYEQGIATLNAALQEAYKYLPPKYLESIKDINVCFDKTASMSGVSNIAQYENSNNRIVVTDKYVYASPKIICAYLVHEFVHAKDRDAYTSVREEQEAYRAATEYWIQNSGGLKDAEMDYAAELYQKSPQKLDERVEEIYTLRDPDITYTSPHHPETPYATAASSKLSAITSTKLKKYDFIA